MTKMYPKYPTKIPKIPPKYVQIMSIYNIGVKTKKWLYLIYLTSNQENNGTLFSLTLKVEESKMSSFSGFEFKLLRYSHLIVFKKTPYWGIWVKTTKWLYLSHLTSNQENKGTLFSSTFKVGEKSAFIFLIWGQIAKIQSIFCFR